MQQMHEFGEKSVAVLGENLREDIPAYTSFHHEHFGQV